jgi:hypothetical protein
MAGQQTIPEDPLGGLSGGLSYQGTWDATANNPFLQSSIGTKNHYYIVSVAGNTPLDGEIDWQIGDWVVFNGTVWQKIDQSEEVTSVFARKGAVTAQAGDYDHAQIGAVGADDHHPKSHAHDGADGSGQVAHANTTGQGENDHHDKSHAHNGADGSGQVAHSDTTGQGPDDHHNRQHALSSGADHTGAITDVQHGARGGGSLHALAIAGGAAGFFSGADKSKLDNIPSGTTIGGFTFGDQGGAGVSKAGVNYAARRYWIFEGTTALGLTSFDVRFLVERITGANTGSVRIYDVTNGAVIAEVTGIADGAPTIHTTAAANLSTGIAIWRLDLEGGTGSNLACYSAHAVK